MGDQLAGKALKARYGWPVRLYFVDGRSNPVVGTLLGVGTLGVTITQGMGQIHYKWNEIQRVETA